MLVQKLRSGIINNKFIEIIDTLVYGINDSLYFIKDENVTCICGELSILDNKIEFMDIISNKLHKFT